VAPEHVNRDEVDRRQTRLLDAYGDAWVETETVDVPADEFPEHVENARDGYVGGGYAFVVRAPGQTPPLTESMPDDAVPDGDRVLLILHRASENWGVPGGGLEGDESFGDAAIREVREETGVTCKITGLYGMSHVEWVSAGDHSETLHSLHVYFDARYVEGALAPQPGEVYGAAWFGDPPANAIDLVERRGDDWPPSPDDG
jgi:8-oxo-dGTP pyrophosphatase MutT (NUDIX family)